MSGAKVTAIKPKGAAAGSLPRKVVERLNDESPSERPGTRIRALLARTRPLTGSEVPDVYWEGRSLIESLALAFDCGDDGPIWGAIHCATVLEFLSTIEPTEGNCFCNDPSDVNATCGFHVILNFMADELRRGAPKAKDRKRTAEVQS